MSYANNVLSRPLESIITRRYYNVSEHEKYCLVTIKVSSYFDFADAVQNTVLEHDKST